MSSESKVTVITKYSTGGAESHTSGLISSGSGDPDSLTNSSPVEFQELSCPAPSVRTLSTYNYSHVTVEEVRGISGHPKLHRHDYFEMIFPLSGRFEMQIESMLRVFERWDLCVLNCTTKHTEHFEQGDSLFYLHLSADYLRAEPTIEKVSLRSFGQMSEFFYRDISEGTRHWKNCIHFHYVGGDMISPLHRIFTQMRAEMEHKEPGFQLLEYALVFRMFCILNDPAYYRAEYINFGSDDGASLALSAKQILDRTNRKMTKDELSERLNYDAEYINRIFKRHYGYSIPEYNRRRCMQLAADMLQNTRLSVSEICRRVDYTNRTHFYRMFAEQYGCTPIEYRARQFSTVSASAKPKQ